MAAKPPQKNNSWWIHVTILVAAYLGAALMIVAALTASPRLRQFVRETLSASAPKEGGEGGENRRPSSTGTLARNFVPRKDVRVAELFNGMTYRTRLETGEGGSATVERTMPDSYSAELIITIRVPKPVDTLTGLERANPGIAACLPGLAQMIPAGRVSNFYHELYRIKVDAVKGSADRLDDIVSRHNFYDCDTILELQHPETRRKVLLLQSEMDVVTDGTDPDRTLKIEGVTSTFQPFTSYRWPRRTKTSNPFAESRRAKVAEIDRQLAAGVKDSEKAELTERRKTLRLEIADLERFSFLVGRGDPFIVLPGFIYRASNHPFHPKLGDYAVVVHAGTLYPAIFGDTGPSHKTGEASLFISRSINPKANAAYRPLSNLEATYLVFPGSADPSPGPPNLDRWRARCEALLNEIGGYRGSLHKWESPFQPPPTPTPSPTPVPSAVPSPTLPPPLPSEPLPSAPLNTPAPPAG